MLTMLLGTKGVVALSFPYIIRPLTRMTLECRGVRAVHETGRMMRLVLKKCRWRMWGLWSDYAARSTQVL